MRTKDIVTSGFNYQNVKVLKDYQVTKSENTAFGLPVWMDFRVEAFDYILKDSNGKEIKVSVPEVHIPCCIVEANGSKSIVKTAIQGLNTRGTVKEYINHGDVNISIKGVIANDKSNVLPGEKLNALIKLIEAPVSIKIKHNFLNNYLQVFNLVIESYSFPSKQGMQNLQLFELNCVSDEPIELVEKNKPKQVKEATKINNPSIAPAVVEDVNQVSSLTSDQKASIGQTISKVLGNVGKVSADVRAKMDTVGVDFETLTNPNVPMSQKLGQMKKLLGDKSIITDILNTTDGGQIIDNLILTQNQYDEMMRARTQFELFLNQYV